MSELSSEDQLYAACRVYHGYETAKKLHLYHPGNLNGVPSREWFRGNFEFSQRELMDYIQRNEGLAFKLLNWSIDNRGVPSAYMVPVDNGYTVGWFDGERHDERFFGNIELAAADYVLAFWGLPRLKLGHVSDQT